MGRAGDSGLEPSGHDELREAGNCPSFSLLAITLVPRLDRLVFFEDEDEDEDEDEGRTELIVALGIRWIRREPSFAGRL